MFRAALMRRCATDSVSCGRARDGGRGVEGGRPADRSHRPRGASPIHRGECRCGQRRPAAPSRALVVVVAVVEPHLWAGVGLARSGVGVAIVGDPSQVAAKLRGYQALGISTFILSGYPHLEECRRFGEIVMPLLRAPEPRDQARPAAELSAGVGLSRERLIP